MDNYANFSADYVHCRITVILFAACECNKQNLTMQKSLAVLWCFLRKERKKTITEVTDHESI